MSDLVLRTRLSPSRSAPAQARALVERACSDLQHTDLRDTAALVVTELVANAVVHAGTEIDFSVSVRGECVHVVVADRDHRPPRRGRPAQTDGRGRGLVVVDALAESWGDVPTENGKMVWARVCGGE